MCSLLFSDKSMLSKTLPTVATSWMSASRFEALSRVQIAKSDTRREVTPAAQRAVLIKDIFHPRVSFSGQKIVVLHIIRVCFKFKRIVHVSNSAISINNKIQKPEQNIENPLTNKQKFKLLLIVNSLVLFRSLI